MILANIGLGGGQGMIDKEMGAYQVSMPICSNAADVVTLSQCMEGFLKIKANHL